MIFSKNVYHKIINYKTEIKKILCVLLPLNVNIDFVYRFSRLA